MNPWNKEKILDVSMNSSTARHWPRFTCCYRKLEKQCSTLLCSSSRQRVSMWAIELPCSASHDGWGLSPLIHCQSLTITQVFITHKMKCSYDHHNIYFVLVCCFSFFFFFLIPSLYFLLKKIFQIAEKKDWQVSKHLENLFQLPAPTL